LVTESDAEEVRIDAAHIGLVHCDRLEHGSDFGIEVGCATESLPVLVHAALEQGLHLLDDLLASKRLVRVLDVNL
jgi:hypothetical protein